MFARIALALSTALLTFAVVCLWSATASAETWEETSRTARPMVQGTVGEWVTVIEYKRAPSHVAPAGKARKASASKPRVGRTTVVARLGERRPVAPTLRVASLDADGTCGGLPAACCDWRTGSRALCSVR